MCITCALFYPIYNVHGGREFSLARSFRQPETRHARATKATWEVYMVVVCIKEARSFDCTRRENPFTDARGRAFFSLCRLLYCVLLLLLQSKLLSSRIVILSSILCTLYPIFKYVNLSIRCITAGYFRGNETLISRYRLTLETLRFIPCEGELRFRFLR